MVERLQPLAGIAKAGTHGPATEDGPGITLSLPRRGSLWQVAAWPESFATVSARLANALGLKALPAPGGLAIAKDGRSVARVEPLKFWVWGPDGAACPLDLTAEDGATLDLSHNEAAVRIDGRNAADLIARLCGLDLRESAFPEPSFATTQAHHMILRVTRADGGYELSVMRSFAETFWDLLLHHGAQFGLEVKG